MLRILTLIGIKGSQKYKVLISQYFSKLREQRKKIKDVGHFLRKIGFLKKSILYFIV